jgi:rhamnogalacturonyl hydrolase YesR
MFMRILNSKKILISTLLLGITFTHLIAAQNVVQMASPISVVKLIGDKLIRDTPFKYGLGLVSNQGEFNGMQVVDFGRTFYANKPAVAYAFTQIKSLKETDMNIQIEHNDGCKVWLNDVQVYSKQSDKKIILKYDERSVEMSDSFSIHLKKGYNNLLIKSETKGNEWRVYIQPPSAKGSVTTTIDYPTIGLNNLPNIDPAILKVSNWLVIGPFKNDSLNGVRNGLNTKYAPESELVFGRMYTGQTEPITWTIPKVEVLGKLINPLIWGTNYTWNYHNGGVAWAMQQLSEISGDKKYDDYATNFCDFHLNGLPFVEYQVKELNAIDSDNSFIVDSKLLDFTTAPTLPLIYKLIKDSSFTNRPDYEKFVNRIMNYAKNEQIRLPGANIFTRTSPVQYTTWVDDMFMGIPFLVQASKQAKTPELKKAFLDDAASQVLGFQKEVWDETAQLYMHAHYSTNAVKLPHWSRANGWAIWATTEVLLNLPKSHPKYKAILAQYRKHVESLVRYQNKIGFWYNVIDRADSKEEVSGTAIFTMAIARGVTNGWLDEKKYQSVVEKGWHAVKTQIEPDGTVNNICMGTMCSEDVNYYLARPFLKNDTHGLFAVLFAGIEVSKMKAKFQN